MPTTSYTTTIPFTSTIQPSTNTAETEQVSTTGQEQGSATEDVDGTDQEDHGAGSDDTNVTAG